MSNSRVTRRIFTGEKNISNKLRIEIGNTQFIANILSPKVLWFSRESKPSLMRNNFGGGGHSD
jgi:hypothetical protein